MLYNDFLRERSQVSLFLKLFSFPERLLQLVPIILLSNQTDEILLRK